MSRRSGPNEHSAAVGAEVRRLRTERGWSMADLARELGWLKSKVQRIEEGTGFLSVDDLMPLARALKVRAQKLLDAGKVPA